MQALLYTNNSDENAILSSLLQQAGLIVRTTRELRGLMEALAERPVDIIMLSFDEANEKRIALITQLRSQTEAPLVVLIDSLSETVQIAFYEAGADLVAGRAIGVLLLLTQVKAILRRSGAGPYKDLPTLSQGDVILDIGTRSVQVGTREPQRLTQLEFRLLYVLLTNTGQIHSAESLVEQVWGYSGEGNRELVRGLVQRLRGKVEQDPRNPQYILTDPGVGYYFTRIPTQAS
jgi:DNA-binding response OmpR family regulator